MKHFRFLVLALLLAAAAAPAVAQTGTGRVVVLVNDETNAPFPGVVVTLSNTRNLAPPQAVRTNAEGRATFGVVPAGGGYLVTIETAGYAKIVGGPYNVQMNQPLMLAFKLAPQITETMAVTSDKPVASLDEPTGVVEISGEFFEDLPILGRNYQSALTLAPGINDADEDGNPNVHGSRARDFKATLDGVSNVDPLTGTFMSNINPDAIEEIEIVTTGADASYGGAVGGFANIITKQGSNEFEGVFKMFYRSSILDRNGASSRPIKEFEYDWYQPSVSLTGKIIRDKLFYALNLEYHNIGEPISFVGGGGLVVKYDGMRHLDKITWQASPRNKLNFQFSADPYSVGPAGVNSRTKIESGYDLEWGGPTYSVEWQTPVNPNVTVKTVVGFSDVGVGATPLTQGVRNACVYDAAGDLDRDYCTNSDEFVSGSFWQTYDDKRQRWTLKSDATFFVNNFLGKEHTFDVGFLGEDEHFESTERYGAFARLGQPVSDIQVDQTVKQASTYFRTIFTTPENLDVFEGEADGRRLALYVQDTFRPHPNVSIKAGLRMEREDIEAPGYEPFDPRQQRRRFQENWVAAGCDSNPDACTRLMLPIFTVFEGAVSIDKAGGVHTNRQLCPGSSLCPYLDISAEELVERLRKPSKQEFSNSNLGPTLNVSWDPKGDGKMKLFATYGRKFDKIFLGVPTTEQGPFRFEQTIRLRSGEEGEIPPGQPQWVRAGGNDRTISPPIVSVISRDLVTPYSNEYTVGFEREIASETSITFTYIRRSYKEQFQDVDVNHYGQDRGDNDVPCRRVGKIFIPQGEPDGVWDDCGGRIVGYEATNLNVGVVEGPDGVPDLMVNNPFFNSIYLVGNLNSTKYTAYELSMLRRLHHNWELEASYVWSKAIGQAEDYLQALGDDPTTVQDEEGYLEFDQRHIVKVNARSLLPVWDLRLGLVGRWESGQPFSITRTGESLDRRSAFGSLNVQFNQLRTTYPSGQRNDRRNESFFRFDVNVQRDWTIGKANLTGGLEVINLLNNDRLRIFLNRNGVEFGERRFGRQYQASLKVNF